MTLGMHIVGRLSLLCNVSLRGFGVCNCFFGSCNMLDIALSALMAFLDLDEGQSTRSHAMIANSQSSPRALPPPHQSSASKSGAHPWFLEVLDAVTQSVSDLSE